MTPFQQHQNTRPIQCAKSELTNAESIFCLTSYAKIQESSILMGVSFKNGHETNNIFAKNYYNATNVRPHNKPT
jgi:hypothetical protein